MNKKNILLAAVVNCFCMLVHADPSTTTVKTPVASPANAGNGAALQQSALWQACLALNHDLQPLLGWDTAPKKAFEHLDAFQLSAETRKKLFDLTGNDNPLHLKSTRQANGKTELAIAVDALDFKDAKTNVVGHVSELNGKVSFGKGFNKMHAVASLPLFHAEMADTLQLTAGGLNTVSDQVRGPFGLWLGNSALRLDHVTIDQNVTKSHLMIDDISIKTEAKAHGKSLDLGSDTAVKSINWGRDAVSQVHVAIRLQNLNAQDIATIREDAKKLNQGGQSNADRALFAKEVLKDFSHALQADSAIEIQDMSASYHGMSGGLNGRIALDNPQDGDLASFATIMRKLDLRINLHIPVGWANAVQQASMPKSPDAKKGAGQPAAAAEAGASGMVGKYLSEWQKKKWIRIDHDTIFSTIEFKAGKLHINGQLVELPKPAVPTPVPAPATAVPGITGFPRALVPGKQIVAPGETDVMQAEFGLLVPYGEGNASFVPANVVPFVPDQSFGWMMLLSTDKSVVKWREEMTLPGKPESWGPPEPLGTRTISADGRVVTTERAVMPVQGVISNFWSLSASDPKGRYVIRVSVEGLPDRVFEFDLK